MPKLYRHIALFLLLLFCRAMVPDALLLELHPHTHTIHTDQTDAKKAQVGAKHKHCPVEDVFGKPFQGSLPPLLTVPLTHNAAQLPAFSCSGYGTAGPFEYLRGPPALA
ncbi:hypothetical protein ACXYMU_16365 [Pontibacter sp. CAU 1760]